MENGSHESMEHYNYSQLKQIKAKQHIYLTHWGQDKMVTNLQISSEFSWMKMHEFQFKIHWSLFPRVQIWYSSINSDNGLLTNRWQAIIWNNDDLVSRYTCASLSLNELRGDTVWWSYWSSLEYCMDWHIIMKWTSLYWHLSILHLSHCIWIQVVHKGSIVCVY